MTKRNILKPDSIRMMPIGDIVPYENNPRSHDDISEIVESIKRVGFRGSIWLDENNVIIAGHGRYLAAKKLGMKDVPVSIMSDLSEAEVKYLRIKDNRASDSSAWIEELLQTEIMELHDMDFDVSDLITDSPEFGNLEDMMESEVSEEYQEFLDKFKAKHTTDDCFTPPKIYDAVKEWVFKEYGDKWTEIVRPFYPGGDYTKEDYPEGCLVLDNPPFSIMSEILQFYNEKGIHYFLFANGLTLFSPLRKNGKTNAVVCAIRIVYENGADVNTSFMTDLGEYKVRTAPDLFKTLDDIQKEESEAVTKYEYPPHVISAGILSKDVRNGADIRIPRSSCEYISKLDCDEQSIFGGGLIISDESAENIRSERERLERERLERERIRAEEREVRREARTNLVIRKLSERERRQSSKGSTPPAGE